MLLSLPVFTNTSKRPRALSAWPSLHHIKGEDTKIKQELIVFCSVKYILYLLFPQIEKQLAKIQQSQSDNYLEGGGVQRQNPPPRKPRRPGPTKLSDLRQASLASSNSGELRQASLASSNSGDLRQTSLASSNSGELRQPTNHHSSSGELRQLSNSSITAGNALEEDTSHSTDSGSIPGDPEVEDLKKNTRKHRIHFPKFAKKSIRLSSSNPKIQPT